MLSPTNDYIRDFLEIEMWPYGSYNWASDLPSDASYTVNMGDNLDKDGIQLSLGGSYTMNNNGMDTQNTINATYNYAKWRAVTDGNHRVNWTPWSLPKNQSASFESMMTSETYNSDTYFSVSKYWTCGAIKMGLITYTCYTWSGNDYSSFFR